MSLRIDNMERFFNRPFTFDRTVRIGLFAVILLFVVFCVRAIWDVIAPFILAGIFAYVLLPFVKFFQFKLRLKSRVASAVIVFILLISLVSLAIGILIPSIQGEINKTLISLNQYNDHQSILELLLPASVRKYIPNQEMLNEFFRNLTPEKLFENVRMVLGQLEGVVSGTISFFSWGLVFVMGLAYFIFILIDFEALAHGFIRLFPLSMRPMVRAIAHETDKNMNSYFRGQGLVALLVGTLLSIGFNIIGLPMATVMGIFIGLLNFIPYMQAFGLIPLALMCILMSAQTGENVFLSMLLGFGVMGIVQVLQDGVIVPNVMGRQMGIRPSLILLSLSLWGSLLGFLGLLIALPLTITLYSVYMRYILADPEFIEKEQKEQAAHSKKKTLVSKG